MFDHGEYEDVIGNLKKQIDEKTLLRQSQQRKAEEHEATLIQMQYNKLSQEHANKARDLEVKRKAFVEANQVLKDQNADRQEREKEEERQERINYFPFTHGDLIENQRKVL